MIKECSTTKATLIQYACRAKQRQIEKRKVVPRAAMDFVRHLKMKYF